MTPEQPPWSAAVLIVDPEYSRLDAIRRDNVTLETDGVRRVNRAGIETSDATQDDVEMIV